MSTENKKFVENRENFYNTGRKLLFILVTLKETMSLHDFEGKLCEIVAASEAFGHLSKDDIKLLNRLSHNILWLKSFFNNFPDDFADFFEEFNEE